MAKTFNPNRVGGGTFSIVRDADGNYSLKEEGFEPISSLNMIDLGAVAATTTAAKTETAAEKAGISTADQTKAAFLLPSGDKEDPFTFEKSLKSGADISKGLQDVETVSDRQKTESQLGETGRNPFRNIDTGVGEFEGIKDPTEPVFGSSMPSKEQFERQATLPSVETPQEKLKLSAAEKEKRKPKFLSGLLDTIKGPKLKTDQTKFTSPSERAALGFPGDKSEVAQAGSTGFLSGIDTRSDQGLTEVPATALGVTAPTGIKGPPSQISGPQIEPPAKKTFADSVSTALKGVGNFVKSGGFTGGLFRGISKQRNEDQATIGLNRSKFNIVTSPGSMQGRIVGDRGDYNPSKNLFHGMNRDSAFGNLENAGKKRIENRQKTIERKGVRSKSNPNGVSQDFVNNTNNMRNELKDYQREKAAEQKATQGPAGGATTGGGGNGGGKTKIVCTMMNESYGFGSFRNKIWLRHSKNLAPEYQRGYHRLFLPLVKKAKTNKILKKILEHIAVHRTIDIRQQERNKIHLIGRVYRTILEPICYWAGKK